MLAGVAVAALLTAIQEYLQQQHTQELQQIYTWILGSLSLASWSDIALILPYVVIAAGLLLAHRRLLDVLRVGEAEAGSLGVNVARLRLTVVLAATLGTAAAVAVTGLIGFVGIIVPHTVRLTWRRELPDRAAGLDGRRRRVPRPRRRRGPDGPGAGRGTAHRDHRDDRGPVLPVRAAVAAHPPGPVVISLEDVRVSYGPAVALDGVTERAADGEWLGLIGPNGAGKTTLLQAVARQVRHGGRVEVCGQPTAGMSRRKLARLVAYVPQRPLLPPDMTVGDYVLLGRTRISATSGWRRTPTGGSAPS